MGYDATNLYNWQDMGTPPCLELKAYFYVIRKDSR